MSEHRGTHWIVKVLANVRGLLLCLGMLLSALYLAWWVNAQWGYGYAWLYDYYEIETHIAEYAPQNRHRLGFESTTPAQHKLLFQQIVTAVHHDGEGLSEISYSFQRQDVPLLHHDEIVHLQDVARLIERLWDFSVWVSLVTLMLLWRTWRLRRLGRERMSMSGVLRMLVCVSLMLLLVPVIIGAKEVFYQLHVMIFPADHVWFFYYQDSLMSTLMKAPDLFAGIALQIALLGALLFAVLYYCLLYRPAREEGESGRSA